MKTQNGQLWFCTTNCFSFLLHCSFHNVNHKKIPKLWDKTIPLCQIFNSLFLKSWIKECLFFSPFSSGTYDFLFTYRPKYCSCFICKFAYYTLKVGVVLRSTLIFLLLSVSYFGLHSHKSLLTHVQSNPQLNCTTSIANCT